jgi:hypothetical protein
MTRPPRALLTDSPASTEAYLVSWTMGRSLTNRAVRGKPTTSARSTAKAELLQLKEQKDRLLALRLNLASRLRRVQDNLAVAVRSEAKILRSWCPISQLSSRIVWKGSANSIREPLESCAQNWVPLRHSSKSSWLRSIEGLYEIVNASFAALLGTVWSGLEGSRFSLPDTRVFPSSRPLVLREIEVAA